MGNGGMLQEPAAGRGTPPRVSVVTVLLNAREFIREAMQSVLEQTYAHLEYIVIDGGSSDGSLDIVRSFAPRLACWVSEPDRGIADAFNKGFARARGDYILFLNADDALAAPDVVQKMMRAAADAGCPEFVYGDCVLVERDTGRQISRLSRGVPAWGRLLGRMIPQPALFTHRSYFESCGGFDTSFRIAMDFEHQLRGMSRCRVLRLRELVTRMRSGGLSTVDRQAVVEETLRALRKHGLLAPPGAEFALRTYFSLRRVLAPARRRLARRRR